MDLLLRLTELSPLTPDWTEIVDKAGGFLVNAGTYEDACRIYRAALKVRPDELEFMTGLGWAFCRADKHVEALPWLRKAIAKAPDRSSVLNDYGWALTELGRFEEAEAALKRAVKLAQPEDELPLNNLEEMRRRRQRIGRKRQRERFG